MIFFCYVLISFSGKGPAQPAPKFIGNIIAFILNLVRVHHILLQKKKKKQDKDSNSLVIFRLGQKVLNLLAIPSIIILSETIYM